MLRLVMGGVNAVRGEGFVPFTSLLHSFVTDGIFTFEIRGSSSHREFEIRSGEIRGTEPVRGVPIKYECLILYLISSSS